MQLYSVSGKGHIANNSQKPFVKNTKKVSLVTIHDSCNISFRMKKAEFQKYCQTELNEKYYRKKNIKKITDTISPKLTTTRAKMLKEWINGISTYSPSTRLMILSSLTKKIEENNKILPPKFDIEILDKTLSEINDTVNNDKELRINFCRKYETNVKNNILEQSESRFQACRI